MTDQPGTNTQALSDGVVIVDKPAGWTSHDVVARTRRLLGTRKVGHSGTLDPDATGVLVLGIGRATRLLRYLSGLDKRYVGQVVLGTETSTLDSAGEVTARHEMGGIGLDDVRAAAAGFVGSILQIPPMVSAIKVDGKRLHELAREGKVIERKPRPVVIHSLEVAATANSGVFEMSVHCGSGTYIRSLAADIGSALGGGAHLRSLRRLAVGSFTIDEAGELEHPIVLPAIEALRDMARINVDAVTESDVLVGKVLERDRLGAEGDGPWAVIGVGDRLLATYIAHRGTTVKPEVVVAINPQ